MKRVLNILMADDDPDDCLLVRHALEQSRLAGTLRFVSDGEELLDYLHRHAKCRSDDITLRPDLIFLDLNMPRKDGREALREIKTDASLKRIPIVVLTTSKVREDVLDSYLLGANSFVTKPASFESLREILETVVTYWFDTVRLPPKDHGESHE